MTIQIRQRARSKDYSAKIPIKNLFYLLCYAWDTLEPGEIEEVGTIQTPGLENLMAFILLQRMERLLRRGLERDYQENRDDMACVRGRIDFQDTTKRLLRRRGVLHVIFDELSPDTISNRILKTSIGTLLGFETLSAENHKELKGLYRGLRDVSETRIANSIFHRVRLHRNNRDYRLLLSICEMIHRYTLPTKRKNGMRFIDFDKRLIWDLFQQFVRNFLSKKQTQYSVNPDEFPWLVSRSPAVERFSLPWLKTDVVLTGPTSKIVIETKFYQKPLLWRHGKLRARSLHVNQILAYMQNIVARETEKQRQVDGILLYAAPAGGFPPPQEWTLFGHRLRVASLDLSKEWTEIEKELLSVIVF